MKNEQEASHSEQQAKAQFESIREMVEALSIEGAAKAYASELSVEQCVALLKAAEIAECSLDDVEMLREQVADEIANETIEPDDFEFDEDSAREAIQEDPLSVEVRSGWHTLGEEGEAEEYMILLCTGGPACRIVGSLGNHNEPDSARIEHRDWGTPWTEYRLDSDEEGTVLAYARQFYFGE